MNDMNYVVVMTPDADGQIAATVPDLPGVFATGANHDEAQTNVKEAIRLYVEETLASQQALPDPQTVIAVVPAGV